ncbi:MAG: hypothetical protein KatS3mg109_0720 [Pirellulaceae bacterium]|nr:MAG: hypothetical protein KatS3mg109_0720 [Pirellulaceae bacterium]GIW95508.1 MAG: hypothetical protein KatS3mg110_3549 [Pirellulaceae bacterium]
MKRFWQPTFVFWGQVLLVAAGWYATGLFRPQPVPDTPSYEQFPWHDPLRAMRTVGYPALLYVSNLVDSGHDALIVFQFLWQVICVRILWQGLAVATGERWRSMIAASALLYSHFFYRYGNALAPDAVAAATAIAVVGWLLQCVYRPTLSKWLLLTAGICVAYHLRPAYLFLVVYAPVLAVWLLWYQSPGNDKSLYVRAAVRFVIVSFGPLVAYCCLRWILVGQLGLVAFGGANFAGVVTAFLKDADVERLPSDLQPLATMILSERRRWQERGHEELADPTVRYSDIERGFDWRTWKVCVPAARRVGHSRWHEIDAALWRVAWQIAALQPSLYLAWLAKAFLWGVHTAAGGYLLHPLYAAVLFWVAIGPLWRRDRTVVDSVPSRFIFGWGIVWGTAFSYMVFKLAFIILTTPPLGRMADAAALLMSVALFWAAGGAALTRPEASRNAR